MDSSGPAAALSLARMVRPQPRRWRGLVWAAAGAALALKLLAPPAADCRTAVATAAPGRAAEVCEREYLVTRDPWTGARLADAERRAGQLAVAGALAQGLLVSDARAEALWVIGMVAVAEHRLDVAWRTLENARALELAAHRDTEAARDTLALVRLAAPGH